MVGPRPLPLRYVPSYSPRQAERLLVRFQDSRAGPRSTAATRSAGPNGWSATPEYVEMLGPLVRPVGGYLHRHVHNSAWSIWQAMTGRGIGSAGADDANAQATSHHGSHDDCPSAQGSSTPTPSQTVAPRHFRSSRASRHERRSSLRDEVLLDRPDAWLTSIRSTLPRPIVLLERSLGVDPFRSRLRIHAPRPGLRTVSDLISIYTAALSHNSFR
jgi:hypothetical protein